MEEGEEEEEIVYRGNVLRCQTTRRKARLRTDKDRDPKCGVGIIHTHIYTEVQVYVKGIQEKE